MRHHISWKRFLGALLVALVPLVASWLLVRFHLGENMGDFVPYWNDEIINWHQSLTFRVSGFNGGYYIVNEVPPVATFSHYYTYGPWYPMLNAAFALFIGWSYASGLIVNFLLLGGALFAFCYLLNLDKWRLLLTAVFVITFWPLMLFIVSNMQETLHQALGVLFALLFYAAIKHLDDMPNAWKLAGAALITIAGLLRMSWVMLYLPFFFLVNRRSWKGILLTLAETFVGSVLVVLAWQYVNAQGNNSVFAIFNRFGISFAAGWQELTAYFNANLTKFFDLGAFQLGAVQTVQVVVIILICGALLIWSLARHRQTGERIELVFHLFNLLGIIFASLMLYIIGTGGDYRVIAAHLMLSVFLSIALNRRWMAGLLIVSALLTTPTFLNFYSLYGSIKFRPISVPLARFEEPVRRAIQYNPDAPSPWCNTLLVPISLYKRQLVGTPGGIGLTSLYNPEDPDMKFKSRYILLDDQNYAAVQRRTEKPDLVFLAQTPLGKLYLNRSGECPD